MAEVGAEQAAADARRYLGEELDLFVQAHAWRRYWAGKVAGSLGRRVLEVGAGLGSSTLALCQPPVEHWVAVEPDAELAGRLAERTAGLTPRPAIHRGTLASLPAGQVFDTALYIDVLEHLADDAEEVARAAARLAPGGRLIALSPAHPGLFSPFDRAIGHQRRYTRRSLAATLRAGGLTVERCFHLDAAGALLSLGNRLLLRQSGPNAAQIAFWNRVVIPLSRLLDPLLGHRVGRSVVAIGRKLG